MTARFYRENDTVMFEKVIGDGSVIGPRPATKFDKAENAVRYARFVADEIGTAVKETVAERAKSRSAKRKK